MQQDLTSRAPSLTGPQRAARLSVQVSWLLMLRWAAVAGQLIAVSVAAGVLRVELPYPRLFSLVGIAAATNVAFETWRRWRRPREPESESRRLQAFLVGVMALDLWLLTGLLYYSGGITNPFIVFFVVNLALSAVLLPAHWAWCLTVAALICVALLAAWHKPLPDSLFDLAHGSTFSVAKFGVLAAYATCATVVTYFITQVSAELQRTESDLRVAEQRRAQSARLESLATLAAGAGHEMASPLSTIAVVAKELSRHLEGADVPPSVLEDVTLIRSELDHCRAILDRMSSGAAGQAVGEELQAWPVATIVEEVVGGFRRDDRVRVETSDAANAARLTAPLQGLAQAVRGVVQNAIDASPRDQEVLVRTTMRDGRTVRFEVIDRGPGMSDEVLARVGEPFFTTKEPGNGMGLGMFLTRNVIERLGGRLTLESAPDSGCTAVIDLPLRPHDAGRVM